MAKVRKGKGYKLTWRGEEVFKAVDNAARKGIDDTLLECEKVAKPKTPVDTGLARSSVATEPARKEGDLIVGRWGGGVHYFIWLEIGARGRPGLNILRGTADEVYPELPDRIRGHLRF